MGGTPFAPNSGECKRVHHRGERQLCGYGGGTSQGDARLDCASGLTGVHVHQGPPATCDVLHINKAPRAKCQKAP